MQKLMPGLLLVLFALLAAETKPTPATYVTMPMSRPSLNKRRKTAWSTNRSVP